MLSTDCWSCPGARRAGLASSFLAVGVALLLTGLFWRTYEPLWVIGSVAGLWVGIQRMAMKHIGKNLQHNQIGLSGNQLMYLDWYKYDGWMSRKRIPGIIARILLGVALIVVGGLWYPPQFHSHPPDSPWTWPEFRTFLVSILPPAFLLTGSALAIWGVFLAIRKIARSRALTGHIARLGTGLGFAAAAVLWIPPYRKPLSNGHLTTSIFHVELIAFLCEVFLLIGSLLIVLGMAGGIRRIVKAVGR
jgi:hypothetical protein